jgi:hypothetical protein
METAEYNNTMKSPLRLRQFLQENPNYTGTVDTKDTYKATIVNGLPHNEDGPAVIWSNIGPKYWLKGIKCHTVEEWEDALVKLKMKRIVST